jgi:predicted nucleotide-binding protein
MPIAWDDIEILRALDRLEQEDRAYHDNGENLLRASAGEKPYTDQDRATFTRELMMLASRGRLTFEQQRSPGNARVPRPNEREFLQFLWHLKITETGRDRARARVVYEGFPDPDEDDGTTIPGLVLDRVAGMVSEYYSASQLSKFLHDSELPQEQFSAPIEDDPQKYVATMLGLLESGGSERRRVLRRFLAALLNGVLAFVPSDEQRQELAAQLARAGWHVSGETLARGNRVPGVTSPTPAAVITRAVDPQSAIFLVHGHALDRLNTVARFVEQATNGHEVVILHERANAGQTLIEKFESNAERAAHAIVLLTADDVGRAASASEGEDRRRGRQNVVLELGFFFGKFGREHVTVLRDLDVEEPSDIRGLVYIPFDDQGSWRFSLARELKASGLDVDLNRMA